MAVIAIDLGGTKIAAALFRENGSIQIKEQVFLAGAVGKDAGALIANTIKTLKGNAADDPVSAVCVCVPGIVYSRKGTVWAPNIPGWEDYPLKEEIQSVIGADIPVRIESDRTCYILGELWKGAAQDCTDAIYMAVGTGIGVGILSDGRVVHGAGDIAGAIGWMALQYPYSEDYIPCGCYEHYASGSGLALQAQKALRCARNYNGRLSSKPISDISSYDVFEAYEEGDYIAAEVLDKAIRMWGMASANLVSLFNPQKVIFGGGVFGPASKFIRRIYDEACKWGQPIAMREVEFCPSQIQGEAALFGAASLAFNPVE